MTEEAYQYDVLIVGCGPSGATLANLLRADGHRVAIFDRDKEVFHAPRAMVIDSETCRIFYSMGIYQKLLPDHAKPFEHHRFVNDQRKTKLAMDFSLAENELGFPPAGLMFHQPDLERLLREDFGSEVDAFLGHEVLEVDGSGDVARVVAKDLDSGETREFTGQYLVGADGGASLCRRSIGAKRVDMNYSRHWVVIDVVIKDDALFESQNEGSEFKCRKDAAVVFVKGNHNHMRFDFEAGEEVAKSFTKKDALRMIDEYLDSSKCEIIRLQPYLFYAGMPNIWRKGRIILAGDSAHQTSPFSGQGLNMGLRDAANLAFKFDLVFRGLAGESLLDTYHAERWDNCAELIKGASARGKMISASGIGGRLFRELLFFVSRMNKWLSIELTRRMNRFSPYKSGLIGDSDWAGHRMIGPMVRSKDSNECHLDDFLGNGFALISCGDCSGDAVTWFADELGGVIVHLGDDMQDHTGELTKLFDKHSVDCVLVRPDRYVFDASNNADLVCRSLRDMLERTIVKQLVTSDSVR